MKQVNTHKRTLVAAGIAAALGMQTTTVFAAEEAEKDVEVIEIKGIRGSVTKSMDLKRSAQGIVDAITAEDIGKMPDTNLAESLQRITGVSIDRQNNEGSRVTVRGWGPEYNMITLNGRQMPAANLTDTAADTRRSFDFANLAAESVSGVQIFKTGKANVTTGGIGATIDIETFKPLKNPGLTASVGIKGIMDDTRIGDDITPEISGIFSKTFADDTIGISLTASQSVRDNYQASGNVSSGWNSNVNADGLIEGAPQNYMYRFEDISRTRTNAQLTLQFRPIENITATLDYTMSELEQDVARQELSAWFGGGNYPGQGTVYTEADANGVISPIFLDNKDIWDTSYGVGSWGTVNENDSLGLNIKFDVTNNLTLSLDYHDSTAEAAPADARGSNNIITAVSPRRVGTTVDFSQNVPLMQITMADAHLFGADGYNTGADIDPAIIVMSGTSHRNGYMKTEIEQLQFDGEYTFDDGIISSINFGIMKQTMDNRSAFSLNQGGDWGGVGYTGHTSGGDWNTPAGDGDGNFNDAAFTVADLTDFPGAGVNGQMVWVDYNQFSSDIAALYAANPALPGNAFAHCATGTLCVNPEYSVDMKLTEEQTAFYVQANLEFEIASMLTTMNIGVRHESTDVSSSSLVPNYTSLQWLSANELLLAQDGGVYTDGTGSYDYVLPNVDINIELTDDLVARASVSKSLARANYAALQAGAAPASSQARTFDASTGSAGDPNLKPFESTNFDLSIEYYYDEGSYASVGFYSKDVKNFHGTSVEDVVIYPGLVNPASGERLAEAVAAVTDPTNQNMQVRDYYVSQGWIVDGNLTGDLSVYDPLSFTVTKPVNASENKVDGFEIAVQHLFGESGFGAQVNYTTVNGDLEYDNTVVGEDQFPLQGLSDSANFVGFYDKDGLQVRIAYNWRDDFLSGVVGGNGQQEPAYTEAYGQLDLSVNYALTEALTVSFEGINVTESDRRVHARGEDMIIYAGEQSARYAVGLRYTF